VSKRITQEFYCNDCMGYFLVRLRVNGPNYKARVKCPKCGREHPRYIIDGLITEQAADRRLWKKPPPERDENILTTMATYRTKPFTTMMQRREGFARCGMPVSDAAMAKRLQETGMKHEGD